MLTTTARRSRGASITPRCSSLLETTSSGSGTLAGRIPLFAVQGAQYSTTDQPSSSQSLEERLTRPPESLEYAGSPSVSSAPDNAGFLRKAVLWMGGYYSKHSTYMRGAAELNTCIREQALNADVMKHLHVPDDFQHQHAMLCLHVWLVLKRLRMEGKPGRAISQIMYDNFQEEVEKMVRDAGVQVRVRKHLSELEKQFYGSCKAYDNSVGPEPVETLASALFRNVYQADEGKKEASHLMEQYVKRAMACLAKTPSEHVLSGRIRF
jgi:cytochrome b pre-mRNA-processing protein 3